MLSCWVSIDAIPASLGQLWDGCTGIASEGFQTNCTLGNLDHDALIMKCLVNILQFVYFCVIVETTYSQSALPQYHWCSRWLRPAQETTFERLKDLKADAGTPSIFQTLNPHGCRSLMLFANLLFRVDKIFVTGKAFLKSSDYVRLLMLLFFIFSMS